MIRWEDPPEGPPLHRWQACTAQLRERPGEWALVIEGEQSKKYAYNSVVKALRRKGCEVRTRSFEDGVSVWARWPDLGVGHLDNAAMSSQDA